MAPSDEAVTERRERRVRQALCGAWVAAAIAELWQTDLLGRGCRVRVAAGFAVAFVLFRLGMAAMYRLFPVRRAPSAE